MGRRPKSALADPDAHPIYTSETSPKDLFTNKSTGEPVKFFIQRDTGKHFIAWLASTITSHGGQVVDVVPLSGYVLIDPPTSTGARLLSKWHKPSERPDRHVVSYTFVRACVVAGELLDTDDNEDEGRDWKAAGGVFRSDMSGLPVEIWLHPALAPDVRREMAIEIEKYGGSTETSEDSARVIIAPRTTKREIILWNDLVRKHDPDENKFIEDAEWVKKCVDTKTFEKTVHRKRNLGGRKAGAKRVEFTEQDDQFLVEYIAEKIPYAEAGGRLGNNLYMDLEASTKEYPWASRHSWHSWRNRYKMRQLIFDIAIRDYVKSHPVDENGRVVERPAVASTSTAFVGRESAPPSSTGKDAAAMKKRPGHPALIPMDEDQDEDEDGEQGLFGDDDDDHDDEEDGAGSRKSSAPPLRPRPKPRKRHRALIDSDEDEGGGETGEGHRHERPEGNGAQWSCEDPVHDPQDPPSKRPRTEES